jgi:hypothetical protein
MTSLVSSFPLNIKSPAVGTLEQRKDPAYWPLSEMKAPEDRLQLRFSGSRPNKTQITQWAQCLKETPDSVKARAALQKLLDGLSKGKSGDFVDALVDAAQNETVWDLARGPLLALLDEVEAGSQREKDIQKALVHSYIPHSRTKPDEKELQTWAKQFKDAPSSAQGKAALEKLLKTLAGPTYGENPVPEVIGELAENPKLWAKMRSSLLALERSGPVEDALVAAAGNRHAWPELMPILLALSAKNTDYVSKHRSSWVIGEMAAKHADIWRMVKGPLLERVQSNQPLNTRLSAFQSLAALMENGPSRFWSEIKAPVLAALTEPDFGIQREALQVLRNAVRHPEHRMALLPALNRYIENFPDEAEMARQAQQDRQEMRELLALTGEAAHQAETRIQELSSRDVTYILSEPVKNLEPIRQAYQEIAQDASAWPEIHQSFWRRAFFEEDETGKSFLRRDSRPVNNPAERYTRTVLAAARHAGNWQGDHDVRPLVTGLLRQRIQNWRDYVARAVIDQGAEGPVWPEMKPALIRWLKESPERLMLRGRYNTDREMVQHCNEIEDAHATMRLVQVVSERIKRHSEDWPDFEASVLALWKSQLEILSSKEPVKSDRERIFAPDGAERVHAETIVTGLHKLMPELFPEINRDKGEIGRVFRQSQEMMERLEHRDAEKARREKENELPDAVRYIRRLYS